MATTTTSTRTASTLASLLERSRYEVITLPGVEEKLLEHVHRDVTITVTASPIKGLGPSIELVERLATEGYPVVPHLSARLIRDRGHLGGDAAGPQRRGQPVRVGPLLLVRQRDQHAGGYRLAVSSRWPNTRDSSRVTPTDSPTPG